MRTLFIFGVFLIPAFVMTTNSTAAQWYAIPQMQNIQVSSFLVMSDSTLFVGGYFHSLYRSTDGGETWVNTAGQIPADTILSLTSAGKYIFAGTNDGICRSSDSGSTWVTANNGFAWGGGAINQFATVDTVLYAANQSGVYRSTDFGATWISDNNGLSTISDVVAPVIGIVSAPSGLFSTQDYLGGAYAMRFGDSTWKYIGLETHFLVASALTLFDTSVFAGGSDGIFMYSGKDTTWLARSNGLPVWGANLEWIFFASTDKLLFLHAGAIDGTVYVTSDFGQLWTLVDGTGLGNTGISAIAANKKYLFAGTQGGVWRIPVSTIATSVNEHSSHIPAQFALYQNYPNPFNPSTTISYQVARSGLVNLRVYDILGKEVATLANGQKQAGTYQVTFDASKLSCGVYFCRLAAGGMVQTRKLMMIK
ncbi:MAG TPA: T9SS type A sorting domain-containing protein [Bacteroidota bacterium]|nr:T9SS type A sorting domain-containing protein [Bacteroidota bacterium]